jgi:hypothetical protein
MLTVAVSAGVVQAALSCIRGGGCLFPSVPCVGSSHHDDLGRLGCEEEFRSLPELATLGSCVFLGSAFALFLAQGFLRSLLWATSGAPGSGVRWSMVADGLRLVTQGPRLELVF